jgi:dTDP-4-dehydrorhamnose reductase
MKILITGARSFLADALIPRLLSKHKLFLTSHKSDIKVDGLEIIPIDLANKNEITLFTQTITPDWIVNCAAISLPDWAEDHQQETRDANVVAVENLTLIAKNLNCRLLHMSTDYVFDGEHAPYIETSPRNPVNFYGQTKAKAEEIIEQSGCDYLICRTTVLYGLIKPHHRPNPFMDWYPLLKANKPVKAATEHITTPTFVEDLADVLTYLIEHDARGIYHTAGSVAMSRFEFARQLAIAMNKDPGLVVAATIIPKRAVRPRHTTLNTDKLMHDYHLQLRPPSEVFPILINRLEK